MSADCPQVKSWLVHFVSVQRRLPVLCILWFCLLVLGLHWSFNSSRDRSSQLSLCDNFTSSWGLVMRFEGWTMPAVSIVCVCVGVLIRSHVCVWGHCSQLKRVDFDLNAQLYCAQLMDDRNVLLLHQNFQQLAGTQPHQYSHEICCHWFHWYSVWGCEPYSHPFHMYLYAQYESASYSRPNMSILVVPPGSPDLSLCSHMLHITSNWAFTVLCCRS